MDLGCGTGIVSKYLEERNCRVTGIDSSKEMLEVAKRKVMGKLYKKNLENFSFKKKFNAIVSHDAINHLLEEKELLKCFRNCYSCLGKKGVFLFNAITPKYVSAMLASNGFGEFFWENAFIWEDFKQGNLYIIELGIFKKTSKDNFSRKRIEIIQRIYSLNKLKELLETAGFEKNKCFWKKNKKCKEQQ